MADGISRVHVPGTYRYIEIDAQKRVVFRFDRDELDGLALAYGSGDTFTAEVEEAARTWDALYGPEQEP